MRKDHLRRYRDDYEEPDPVVDPIHVRFVEMLDELLVPLTKTRSPLQPLAKMAHRIRPALLRDLATIPPAEVAQFLYKLGTKLTDASGVIECPSDPPSNADISTQDIQILPESSLKTPPDESPPSDVDDASEPRETLAPST